jgi:hypothetical protein
MDATPEGEPLEREAGFSLGEALELALSLVVLAYMLNPERTLELLAAAAELPARAAANVRSWLAMRRALERTFADIAALPELEPEQPA